MMRARLSSVLLVFAALATLGLSGCGGSGDDDFYPSTAEEIYAAIRGRSYGGTFDGAADGDAFLTFEQDSREVIADFELPQDTEFGQNFLFDGMAPADDGSTELRFVGTLQDDDGEEFDATLVVTSADGESGSGTLEARLEVEGGIGTVTIDATESPQAQVLARRAARAAARKK